jgi:hypothetical protein
MDQASRGGYRVDDHFVDTQRKIVPIANRRVIVLVEQLKQRLKDPSLPLD